MKLLLDTHLLIWSALPVNDPTMPTEAAALVDDERNDLFFSPVSIWELAIKTARGKADFDVDARALRLGLLRRGYTEIPITGEHACVAGQLSPIHKDPFDRMLVAQAAVETLTLLTADTRLAAYAGDIRLITR